MVDTSDSSFSYVEEYSGDSESSFYDAFVENEILVDFGDDHTDGNYG